ICHQYFSTTFLLIYFEHFTDNIVSVDKQHRFLIILAKLLSLLLFYNYYVSMLSKQTNQIKCYQLLEIYLKVVRCLSNFPKTNIITLLIINISIISTKKDT